MYRFTLLSELSGFDHSWENEIALAEAIFHSNEDPRQIPLKKELGIWLKKTVPDFWCLIFHDDELVGGCLALPVSKLLMEKFISEAITEKEMLFAIQKTPHPLYECLYLSHAHVKKEHRGKNLGYLGFEKILQAVLPHFVKGATAFYWPFSDAGELLVRELHSKILRPNAIGLKNRARNAG